MKKKLKIFVLILCSLVISILLLWLLYANYNVAPYVVSVEKKDSIAYQDKVIINVYVKNKFYKFDKRVWCYLSLDGTIPNINNKDWQEASNGYCSYTLPNGEYNIYIRDSFGNVSDLNKQNIDINKIMNIKTNKDTLYLYKGMNSKITYEIESIGKKEKIITFSSDNNDIATVDENGIVSGLSYGVTYINLLNDNNIQKKIKVYVTDLIRKPTIDTSKPYVGCLQFSDDEGLLIDAILEDRINDAGYGTRAGAIAAARFLTLEFSYRIHYFWENGRLENFAPYEHVDGEGRYYHKGLYLTRNKYNSIEAVLNGPSAWGCGLMNYTTWIDSKYSWVAGKKYPNGLDCSGFVTWVLLNGGFDVGDIGAGLDSEHLSLSDIGERVSITDSLMSSGRVKVGDLIGNNGHAAIIAGWDENNYYIAESLNTTGGVVITTVKRSNLVHNSIYKFIVLMDNVYKEDGNYTEMW